MCALNTAGMSNRVLLSTLLLLLPMTSFFQGLPSSLLLENSEKDRFLLLPCATLPGRPESKVIDSITARLKMVLLALTTVWSAAETLRMYDFWVGGKVFRGIRSQKDFEAQSIKHFHF